MQRRQPIDINGVEHWKCPTCERILPRSDYHSKKGTWNGIRSQCKRCHVAGATRTRDEDAKRDRNRIMMANQRAADPEKFRARERGRNRPTKDIKTIARRAVRTALENREIIKPSACTECGEKKKLTAHHHDYTKPLAVKWLCYLCHGKQHRTFKT